MKKTKKNNHKRNLLLNKEFVRVISKHDLTNVASGCDTTSWTTQNPTTAQTGAG